jgi:glycine/D-amino acid oxidase-like deaminating enzyme/nitrite reductase/ring-hydroxylating ferredoxin subunit
MTEHLDAMATPSLWWDRAATSTPGDQPTMVAGEVGTDWDAVVVGGGLAGLLTALRLAERGARVAVFEAHSVAARTTGHSTAKVTALHGAIYHRLIDGKGLETATRYGHANVRAVEEIRTLIDESDIDCDAVTAPALTCAENDLRILEQEFEAATACGLPVTWTVPTELPFRVIGAVTMDDQLRIDPVRLCHGLVARLRSLGASVYEGIRIAGVTEDRTGCTIVGPGFSIRAANVVITTHLPVVDPALLAGRTAPVRSYIVAGHVADAPDGMYLAADEGWSIRPAGPPSPSKRRNESRRRRSTPNLLVGGEGHEMLDTVESAPHLERLERWAVERYDMEVTHRWSAFDYRPVDGLPFVGHLAPGARRRFVATGFDKWGMSTSMVAADVIADLIDGRDNPTAEILDSRRLLPTVGRTVVKNGAKVAVRFVGDRAAALLASEERLEPGTGVVVRRGASLVARACDMNGRTHEVDAVCRHLGCIVSFNEGEQTWDCPCHGSRYALDGTVLDGPARDALPPRKGPAEPLDDAMTERRRA